jgi:hypothetical protein
VIELAAAEATEPEQDEPLGAEWLPGGSRGAEAELRRHRRVVVAAEGQVIRAQVVTEFRETLASLDETLASLGRRLDVIERQLGIAPPAAVEEEPPEDGSSEESAE